MKFFQGIAKNICLAFSVELVAGMLIMFYDLVKSKK